MRTLYTLGSFLLLHGLQAQPFHKVYGDNLIAHPSFAASPDAFYLAHGQEHELIKTDVDGHVIWSRRLEFNGTPVGIYRIAWINDVLMVSGGHAAQQNFIAALDADGDVLWSNAANFGDINVPTRINGVDDGGYLVVGHRDLGGTFDMTLTRWDVDGDLLWAKAVGDNVFNYFGWSSLVLPGGDVLVVGERESATSSMPLIARFNADGDLLWMKMLTDGTGFYMYTEPTDLVATSDGNYALVATTYNTNFNFDAHVIKFDFEGNALWGKRMYQVGWEEMGGSIIEVDEQLMVSGQHSEGDFTEGHVALLALDGTPGAVKSLPYFRSPSASGFYTGLGQDLVCFAPDNYVLAGECTADLFSPSWHGIATFRLNVDPACTAPAPYPFQYANTTWSDSLLTGLFELTNISEVPATITSAAITIPAVDLCTVLSVDAPAPETAIGLFPNPCAGSCRLVSHERPITPPQVLDAAGRLITVPVQWTGAHEAVLDLRQLVPGVYTVRVQLVEGWHSERLVKE